MSNKKVFEVYQSFDEWVNSHKHSALAIQLELETNMDEIKRYPPDALDGYIYGLEDLRSEIDSEISEAKEWIEYFEKQQQVIFIPDQEVPSAKQLYETILRRSSLPPPGLEQELHERAAERAIKIHNYLDDRADRIDKLCLNCLKTARKSRTREAWDKPFDEHPIEKYFCTDECGDSHMYRDPWAYQRCGECERDVCYQNPDNGWHVQFRDYDGKEACLKCYKDIILENGVEQEKLEAGQIPGMFFDLGNPDALEAGYREVDGFSNCFIKSQKSVEAFTKKALGLMDQGHKVVVG